MGDNDLRSALSGKGPPIECPCGQVCYHYTTAIIKSASMLRSVEADRAIPGAWTYSE
jgi:hypothetical protein